MPIASFNEPGNEESIQIVRDDKDTAIEQGKGIVMGMLKKRSAYSMLQSDGIETAMNNLKSGGFFMNLANKGQQAVNNLTSPIKGIKNWFMKGYTPGEDAMSWKDLFADDWKQRGKFGKGGKLGGWDFTRGFRPGVSADEGGFGSGPTPAGRQTVRRLFGFLTSFRGGGLATLASLVANEFINPQPLADGTLTGNVDTMQSMKLQNAAATSGANATVINNNYYNTQGPGGNSGESGDETLGQGFNADLEKFITNYSIMSK